MSHSASVEVTFVLDPESLSNSGSPLRKSGSPLKVVCPDSCPLYLKGFLTRCAEGGEVPMGSWAELAGGSADDAQPLMTPTEMHVEVQKLAVTMHKELDEAMQHICKGETSSRACLLKEINRSFLKLKDRFLEKALLIQAGVTHRAALQAEPMD